MPPTDRSISPAQQSVVDALRAGYTLHQWRLRGGCWLERGTEKKHYVPTATLRALRKAGVIVHAGETVEQWSYRLKEGAALADVGVPGDVEEQKP